MYFYRKETHFFLILFVWLQVYLKEAPWPSAQSEIKTINAYKTPRDKVQCILRMCSTIMNLLSLANEDSVPGADDFVPVLVFVLIRVSVLLIQSFTGCWNQTGVSCDFLNMFSMLIVWRRILPFQCTATLFSLLTREYISHIYDSNL